MSKSEPSADPFSTRAGAHWDRSGVTFTLASRTATGVELCVFDGAGGEQRLAMTQTQPTYWTRHVEAAAPGLHYGFRVHGRWDPAAGLFHNPDKLLLDPYARAVRGPLSFDPTQTCWVPIDTAEYGRDTRDSASAGLRSVVVDDRFDWQDDRLPKVAWRDTVLYECHVKGMTARHPRLPVALRGRYLGLCAEPIVEHLRDLGVTTLSLLPIAASYTERRLVEAGLTNYWGYQPVAPLAPTPLYASVAGEEVTELKTLIRELHRAGIEVLLDVVLNHTGEGPSLGPSAGPLLGLRGIDPGYFRRDPSSASLDQDFAGCGNTLDLRDPLCLQLALDCLRHWASAYHVDGFRLDLAPILGRQNPDFSAQAPLLMAMLQDPVLQDLKWIAEPWDLGPDGYCLGRFPQPMREWNDRFRDAVRHYARGDAGSRNDFSTRLAGSADVFDNRDRLATHSVNYIVSHDGFTLRDLVSYARKHNEANGEHGRDGHDHNASHNWGVEGETDDPSVIETRRRVSASMLVALACAQGVPMLSHGDELGRTQLGNNNSYCQDGPQSYVDWTPDAFGSSLHTLVRDLLSLRQQRPALRVERHCHGEPIEGLELRDLAWLGSDGRPLSHQAWLDRDALPLGMLRCHASNTAANGRRADIVLVLWNPSRATTAFSLPPIPVAGAWTVRIDTAPEARVPRIQTATQVMLQPHCATVLTWDERE